MEEKKVIVYGFENEGKIFWNGDAILCKSIKTNLPIYAAPIIIEETEISTIIEKINNIEATLLDSKSFIFINKLARNRGKIPSWKIVLHSNALKFKVGYEDEKDDK